MVSNGIYQRKDEGGVTSGTHFSSHSQISDYNTLNERDYEVIDMGEDKHDYHHLQRPSPPMLPGGRSFNFTPPKEFHSMSTLTSQIGGATVSRDAFQCGKMSQNGSFLAKSASEGPEEHVYRELEQTMPSSAGPLLGPVNDIYRSPTDSDSPDSAHLYSRGLVPSMPATDSGTFESLYSPDLESSISSRMQPGGLENVPETGQIFSEPVNPTAFPVHKYELIPRETPQYETPVTTTRVKAVTSPLILPGSQASDGRPRTNSGARYETELPPPTLVEESQYSKLMRPAETLPVLSSANPMYSELSSQELSTESAHESKDTFSQSTAELSKQRPHEVKRFSEKVCSMPPHVDSSGGVNNRTSSVSSATDSLASYIAQLQVSAGEKSATDMEGLLFSEQDAHSQGAEDVRPQPQDGRRRNGSLYNGSRKDNGYQQLQRAWSEERRETVSNGMKMSGFSSSAMDSRSFSGHGHGTRAAALKIHRDLRVNGIDLRLGDYARSKTMV